MSKTKHQLGVGERLSEAPTKAMGDAMNSELNYARNVIDGLHSADLAHCVMLHEAGIVPPTETPALLKALLELRDRGPSQLHSGLTWGDIYDQRDAWLSESLGTMGGWLHTGRARREAITIGWLIGMREDLGGLSRSLAAFLAAAIDLCESHQDTLMPDFTYLQHAHPTTLGHYLLGQVCPLARDLDRLSASYRQVNASPAGSVSTNGSRLPIDRERVRELLGFESIIEHNRDAMWQPDLAIHLAATLSSITTAIDRIVEELMIWATEEFGFVELSDRHCRTSVIMPQKKNPYSLAHLRGKSREMNGRLITIVTSNQTPSGQVDNRTAAYRLLPESIREVSDSLDLLGEVLTGAKFDKLRLSEAVQKDCSWATELVEFLIETEKIDARTGHSIAGSMVARLDGAGQADPDRLIEAFQRSYSDSLKRPWQGDKSLLAAVFDARKIVENRKSIGSCGKESMNKMFARMKDQVTSRIQEIENEKSKMAYPDRLLQAVKAITPIEETK